MEDRKSKAAANQAPDAAGKPGATTPLRRTAATADIEALLGEGHRGHSRGLRRWLIGAAVLVLAALLAWFWLGAGKDDTAVRYLTEAVARGRLVVTVSATGNLGPTNQVDVGSELSGTIVTVFVDDNDAVKKGQVLARLDVSKLNDQIARSRAALAAAEARVLQAAATVREASANLARLRQVAQLSGGKVPSQAELETAEAALARAQADEASARAAVTEGRAALSSDQTNLAKASIRSPINGVVLARKVEPGQTVAASLQAPVLFTLAEDLTKMELRVDIDEADVGQVHEGQPANFTVDAYPDATFPAQITRVDLGSQTKEGVVSYRAVLKVDNADLRLRPGMTATAQITTATRDDALLAPNAALRFTPQTPAAQARSGGSILSNLFPRPPRAPTSRPLPGTKGAAQRVWVLRDNAPVALPVTVGVTDGQHTEITGGELKVGDAVITGSISASP